MYLFRSAPGFFGPRTEWRESFLEEAFLLQYHLNMSYSDVRNLPVTYRRWFISRLGSEFKKRSDARKKSRGQQSQDTQTSMQDNMKAIDEMIKASGEKSFK